MEECFYCCGNSTWKFFNLICRLTATLDSLIFGRKSVGHSRQVPATLEKDRTGGSGMRGHDLVRYSTRISVNWEPLGNTPLQTIIFGAMSNETVSFELLSLLYVYERQSSGDSVCTPAAEYV